MLTQAHELIRDAAEYGAFFRQASGQSDDDANDPPPSAGRQAGGEMLPRPQSSLSVSAPPRRQGCASPGCARP